MRRPIFERPLSDAEREALKAGLRSSDAFTLRRSQILLASEEGKNAYRIARELSCSPHTVHRAFDGERAEAMRELLHQDPRKFGKQSSLWTLDMAAEVSFEEGFTERRVSGETIRATLKRMGVRWERAKRWITSPDPEYARKKGGAIG